jgi:hypothetical protein
MNRCFDINLKFSVSWTEGEYWSECNTFASLNSIYSRLYTAESDEVGAPVYRLNNADNFYIASPANSVKDITKKNNAWDFFIDGVFGGEISFYFGLQVGTNGIDSKLDIHAPYIIAENPADTLCNLNADWHRFYGLKTKGFGAVFSLVRDIEGLTIDGLVSFDGELINDNGFSLSECSFRNIHLLEQSKKSLTLNSGSINVSHHEFSTVGKGDCGISIGNGHSGLELIAGKIINEDHGFEDLGIIVDGIVVGSGDTVVARFIELHGFSGETFHFDCKVEARRLESYKCGAGIYIGGAGSTLYGCMVAWTRQVSGDSFAYYANADCQLINCSSNMDETGGLGVIVVNNNAVVNLIGGDYRARLPLPFITALSDCTIIFENVRLNGVMYSETLNLLSGQSWRGTIAGITIDTLEVYANKTLSLPHNHIPALWDAVSIQGSDRPFENVITLPSGAKLAPMRQGSVKYIPDEAWLHLDPGETAFDYFRYSTETEIFTHKFIINSSDKVGAKLIAPDSLSGTGWARNDEQYSCTDNSSPLSANVSLTANKVYQISLKISDISAGSVTPIIDGATTVTAGHSHSVIGTEVWLIRAPASTTSLQIVPVGFTGTIENIYLRELLTSGAVPTPELTATGGTGEIFLDWKLLPISRIRDTITATLGVSNQELTQESQGGFISNSPTSDYLLENVSCSGRRKGISVYGGNSLEIWNFDHVGGFTGQNERWQNAVIDDQNSGPFMALQQLSYITSDLLLDSSFGNYSSQFGNSDCIVINGGLSTADVYDKRAYILGLDGSHGSDSVIDTKANTEINHSTLTGSYRCFRLHNIGTGLLANCQFKQEIGTREAITTTHSFAIAEIWNSEVDGIRCVTTDQMLSIKKDSSFYFTGSSQLSNVNSIFVLKTYPNLHDYARINMTDMEFQSSTDGTNWSTIAVDNIGLPGVIGCLKRTVSLTANTYSIRARCLNGADIGDWSTVNSITVS